MQARVSRGPRSRRHGNQYSPTRSFQRASKEQIEAWMDLSNSESRLQQLPTMSTTVFPVSLLYYEGIFPKLVAVLELTQDPVGVLPDLFLLLLYFFSLWYSNILSSNNSLVLQSCPAFPSNNSRNLVTGLQGMYIPQSNKVSVLCSAQMTDSSWRCFRWHLFLSQFPNVPTYSTDTYPSI